MFNIVLVEPEIPQNTGNIARTCAATGCALHLVKPLGFGLSDKYLKRAGLDYWQYLNVTVWDNLDAVFAAYPNSNYYFYTTKGRKRYDEAKLCEGDFLFFGKETAGLSEELLKSRHESCLRIPMVGDLRSLNLSNSVAIAVYEGLRQNDFKNFRIKGELHRLRWDD